MRGLRDLAPAIALGRVGRSQVAVFRENPDGGLRVTFADYGRAFGDAVATCPELIPTQGGLIALLRYGQFPAGVLR